MRQLCRQAMSSQRQHSHSQQYSISTNPRLIEGIVVVSLANVHFPCLTQSLQETILKSDC